jgi:anti-sigma factor RsiW
MIPDMDCQDLVEIVTAYFDHALTPEEREIFEHHLEECDGCLNYVAQLRLTVALTGTLTPDDIAPETMQTLLAAFRRATADPG